ncbi:MAG: hypothetical protein ACI81P_002905 [Neolewinella sp.]
MKNIVTVHLSFSEVRRICKAQIAFTEKTCPWARNVSLRTSFNNELELLDMDWDAFMWPWADEFGIPIYDQFSYYDYFWDVAFLPFTWFEALVVSLKNGHPIKWEIARPVKPDLTVGDFAASVILGRFVPRKKLRVVLTRN